MNTATATATITVPAKSIVAGTDGERSERALEVAYPADSCR